MKSDHSKEVLLYMILYDVMTLNQEKTPLYAYCLSMSTPYDTTTVNEQSIYKSFTKRLLLAAIVSYI